MAATVASAVPAYAQGLVTLDHETEVDALPVEGALPPWLAGSLSPWRHLSNWPVSRLAWPSSRWSKATCALRSAGSQRAVMPNLLGA